MKIIHEDFGTGWHGISLALKQNEIDKAIDLLNDLKQGTLAHFHIRSLFPNSEQSGIADIEFSVQGDNDQDNASIS